MDTINLDINKTDKITECDNQFDLVVPTLEESINELSTLLVEICTKVNRHPRGYENELISVYKQYNKEESVIDYLKIFVDFKGNTIKEAINAIKENRYAIIEQSNQNWPWLLNCYADNDPSALKNN